MRTDRRSALIALNIATQHQAVPTYAGLQPAGLNLLIEEELQLASARLRGAAYAICFLARCADLLGTVGHATSNRMGCGISAYGIFTGRVHAQFIFCVVR
jgi:hypothetical protein